MRRALDAQRDFAEQFLPQDPGWLEAEATYEAYDLHARLEAWGMTPVIAHNPCGRGLALWQQWTNFVVRTVRPRAEPVFGALKCFYGLARTRGFTRTRNATDATMKALA